MTWTERLYIYECFRGLFTTLKHALRGLFRYEQLPTISYPEGQPDIPRNYRAKHRLMLRPDGTPRCVACGMCAAACPAHCIFIEATASEDPRIEKRVMRFDIDHLVCVFCGLCVEACPVDALRMDTKEIIFEHRKREDFVASLSDLISWDPKDYPEDAQSQVAPGGKNNAAALKVWGMEVK
ncbi:MAG: NADH-quinone oxidoreductase subunit I [Fibrobacter sp.]|nr:NADH-quinone oxidoreductase subunit I [Fibrobacter sp.]